MSDKQPTIIRSPKSKDDPYARIHRLTLRDKALSWEARGVLGYLLSMADNWKINVKDLQQQCGRDRVYKIINELIHHRYLIRVETRDDNGKITGYEYQLYERPYDLPFEEPLTEKPYTDLPFTENTDYKNKEKESKNKEKKEKDAENFSADDSSISKADVKSAIIQAFGWNVTDMGKSNHASVGKAVNELLGISSFVLADVPKIYDYCKGKYSQFTPHALVSNFPAYRAENPAPLPRPAWLRPLPPKPTGEIIPPPPDAVEILRKLGATDTHIQAMQSRKEA